MAVKLRLRRMGRRKRPMYSVVAADSRSPRDGRFIEDLGRYNPLNNPAEVDLKSDRLLYWLENGAQPTDTVRSLLSREGVMLALHMRRKGKSEEEIQSAVAKHREQVMSRLGQSALTAADRRKQALEEERKQAAAAEAEAAKKRAAAAKKKSEKDAEVETTAQVEPAADSDEAVKDESTAAETAPETEAESAPRDSTETDVAEAAPETESVEEAVAEEERSTTGDETTAQPDSEAEEAIDEAGSLDASDAEEKSA